MSLRILLFVCAVAALSASLAGQDPSTAQPVAGQGPVPGHASAAPPLTFEVASIKGNTSGNLFIGISVDAGQFTATNFPVGQSSSSIASNGRPRIDDW